MHTLQSKNKHQLIPPVILTGGIFVPIFVAPAQQKGGMMIQIRITENGIRMDGHAGCRRNGQDLVCAAISALTCSLLHSIQDLAGDRIRAETGDGFTQIEWEKLSEAGKLLVDSWFLAVDDINQQYHCIQYVT